MIREVTPSELAGRLAAGERPVLLDVRTVGELRLVRFPDAVHIPLFELADRAEQELEPGDAIVVICHHGVRSLAGASILAQLGFTDVASLRGGVDRWAIEVDPSIGRY